MLNNELSNESSLFLAPGTRVQLLKSFLVDVAQYGYVINHTGFRKKDPPNIIKEGTIGTIEKMNMFDLYSVSFSIRMRSDEFACIRLVINKKDFKLPEAVVYNFKEERKKRKGG